MRVKLARHEGEFYVLAHSDQRQLKEKAMHRRRFKAYGRGLHALRRRCEGQRPMPQNFHYQLNAEFSRDSLEGEGSYILRSNATQSDAATMWSMYMQLTFIESAFKSLKSDLAIRPIFHQLQHRVEAHLFLAFMGYCLLAALRKHIQPAAPGLSPKAVLRQLGAIKMVDVCLSPTDGRWLIMPRYTEPEPEQLMLLEKLGLKLPARPPPRIRSGKLLINEPEDQSVTA